MFHLLVFTKIKSIFVKNVFVIKSRTMFAAPRINLDKLTMLAYLTEDFMGISIMYLVKSCLLKKRYYTQKSKIYFFEKMVSRRL